MRAQFRHWGARCSHTLRRSIRELRARSSSIGDVRGFRGDNRMAYLHQRDRSQQIIDLGLWAWTCPGGDALDGWFRSWRSPPLSRESFRRHRTVTIDDPNDSPSAIDVAHVVQGHYSRYVLYRVVAHERWNSGALEDGRIIFSFNTDNDADVERRTIREYKGGGGAQFRLRIENVTGAGSGELCYVVPVAALWRSGLFGGNGNIRGDTECLCLGRREPPEAVQMGARIASRIEEPSPIGFTSCASRGADDDRNRW